MNNHYRIHGALDDAEDIIIRASMEAICKVYSSLEKFVDLSIERKD